MELLESMKIIMECNDKRKFYTRINMILYFAQVKRGSNENIV